MRRCEGQICAQELATPVVEERCWRKTHRKSLSFMCHVNLPVSDIVNAASRICRMIAEKGLKTCSFACFFS
jgi:hypothetical protein